MGADPTAVALLPVSGRGDVLPLDFDRLFLFCMLIINRFHGSIENPAVSRSRGGGAQQALLSWCHGDSTVLGGKGGRLGGGWYGGQRCPSGAMSAVPATSPPRDPWAAPEAPGQALGTRRGPVCHRCPRPAMLTPSPSACRRPGRQSQQAPAAAPASGRPPGGVR